MIFSRRTYLVVLSGLALVAIVSVGFLKVSYLVHRSSVTFDGPCPVLSDPETAFIPAPNSKVTYNLGKPKILFHVYTDARSGRVSAPGTPAPRHADIVFVGCSMTFGFGVENQQNYASLVGKELGVTIENLSYDGWGTLPALVALRRNRDLAPKVVIYGFVRDHIRRNVSPCSTISAMGCWRQPHLVRGPNDEVTLRMEQPNAWFLQSSRRYCDEVLTKTPERRDTLHDYGLAGALVLSALVDYASAPATTDDVEFGIRISSTRYAIEQLKSAAEQTGSRFILLNLPNHFARGLAEPMCDELKQSLPPGVFVIDAAPDVISYYRSEINGPLNIAGDLYHPNPEGHRIVAKKIVEVLRPMHLFDK